MDYSKILDCLSASLAQVGNVGRYASMICGVSSAPTQGQSGFTPMCRARKFGYMEIENFLSWRGEGAIPEMLRTSTRQADSDSSEDYSSSGICDIYWLHITGGSDAYYCGACRDGFYVYKDCFSLGAQCLYDGHGLRKNRSIPNGPRWRSVLSSASSSSSSSGSSNC